MTMENLYPALQKAPERQCRPYGRIALMVGALLFSAYCGLKAVSGSPLRDSRPKPHAMASNDASQGKLGLAFDEKLLPAKTNVPHTKKIEDIVRGDFVIARDEQTGTLERKEV